MKHFGQPRRVVHRPRDERPVGPEAAIGDEQVRMPVCPGAMRLQTSDDPDGEFAFTRQRADRRRDGAGGDAGDRAMQAATVHAIGVQPLRDREHHLPVRHGREERGVQPVRPDREALGVAVRRYRRSPKAPLLQTKHTKPFDISCRVLAITTFSSPRRRV